MPYAFDLWLTRTHPGVMFQRYADDVVVHGESEALSQEVLAGIATRMTQVGLSLHPSKTGIVYCKDNNRPGRDRGHPQHAGPAGFVLAACGLPAGIPTSVVIAPFEIYVLDMGMAELHRLVGLRPVMLAHHEQIYQFVDAGGSAMPPFAVSSLYSTCYS